MLILPSQQMMEDANFEHFVMHVKGDGKNFLPQSLLPFDPIIKEGRFYELMKATFYEC